MFFFHCHLVVSCLRIRTLQFVLVVQRFSICRSAIMFARAIAPSACSIAPFHSQNKLIIVFIVIASYISLENCALTFDAFSNICIYHMLFGDRERDLRLPANAIKKNPPNIWFWLCNGSFATAFSQQPSPFRRWLSIWDAYLHAHRMTNRTHYFLRHTTKPFIFFYLLPFA